VKLNRKDALRRRIFGKHAFRLAVRGRKDELSEWLRRNGPFASPDEWHAKASEAICRAIWQDRAWQEARLVCAFLPMQSEPNIRPLWSKKRGPAFCFPRLVDGEIELIQTNDRKMLASADWRLAAPEFANCPRTDLKRVDLVLVPGVAFTLDGHRLGRGGGFYDRLLEGCTRRQRTLGVCFHSRLFDELPIEAHDQRVERVITELSDV
jgi:5-formyltetrahydrofolate cyclo-ligase